MTPIERINRAAAKLQIAPSCSLAVDILFASLSKAREFPHSERYRKVSVANAVFKESVLGVPGGTELLYAVGYEPMFGHLVLQQWSEPLLTHALETLSRLKESSAYLSSAAMAQSAANVEAQRQAELAVAAQRRAAHASRVPKEPEQGDAATKSCVVINIKLVDEKIASRKFDSEATLRDLLHFVRSLERVPNPEAPLRLENVTTAPAIQLNAVDADLDRSLYSLDLWPVSHVRVCPVGA